MRRSYWLAALVLFPGLCQPADMRVAPTKLRFDAEDRVQPLLIANPGESPILVELQAFQWSQADGRRELTKAPEVILSPPVAEIGAGSSVTVRVGFRHSPQVTVCESAYRLWLTEVPRSSTTSPVRMRTRMDLPVFRQNSADCKPKLSAYLRPSTSDIVIRNDGSEHVLIQDIALQGALGEHAVPLPSLGYLLAGSAREFQVLMPEGKTLNGANFKQVLLGTSRQKYTVTLEGLAQ